MNLRPAALVGAASVTALLWLGWGVAHPSATVVTVTVMETRIAPPLIEQPPPVVIVTRAPGEQPERVLSTSAAHTAIPRYYDAEGLHELLAETPWGVHLWPAVVALVSCESPTPEGADALAVGDVNLMPFDGPSYGLTQININAWPQYARSYDLKDPHENLLAAWSIYVESGYSFAPWSCRSVISQ
jgi:hypothetical protein